MSGKKKPTTPTPNDDGVDPPSGIDCDMEIDCDLVGVQPEVLATLREGDPLDVRLERGGGGYESVVCTTASGEVVGAVTAFPGHARLVNCLRRQVRYRVLVGQLGAGRCHVLGGMVR